MTPERPASGPLRRPPQAVGLVGLEKSMPWGAIVRDFHGIEEMSFRTFPLRMLWITRAAAAEAWATESGMSFGPWQTPARLIPPLQVLVGCVL